jgi:hypothetical protein
MLLFGAAAAALVARRRYLAKKGADTDTEYSMAA